MSGCHSNTEDCNKADRLDLKYTFYSGAPLEPLNIYPEMTGDEIVRSINDYLRSILADFKLDTNLIGNTGNGIQVYKGLSEDLIDEFKTLVGIEGIIITPKEDTVEFKIDTEWFKRQVDDIVNGSTTSMTVDFKWSSNITKPLNPDKNPTIWHDEYVDGDIWMALKEVTGNISTWSVIKVKGDKGDKGDKGEKGDPGIGSTGAHSYTSTVFKRSLDKPDRPVGGTYANSTPSGWSDGIPEPLNGWPVWMSMRVFTSDGREPQETEWSDPEKTVDTATVNFEWSDFLGDDPGTPDYPANGATWHDHGDSTGYDNDVWMAIQRVINGIKTPWKVMRIKGEDGKDGEDGVSHQTQITSFIFTRSETQPETPKGGSYFNPMPYNNTIWSDGIPGGTGTVWTSSRIFTSDGKAPQQSSWNTPVVAIDSMYMDYAYSSSTTKPYAPADTQSPLQDDSVWHNTPTEQDIWMAMRPVNNGLYGTWVIYKIKGEKGEIGQSSFKSIVFKRFTDSEAKVKPSSTQGSYDNPVPDGWSDGIPTGVGKVYQTTRVFTSDGLDPQQLEWTDVEVAVDTSTVDFEYSYIATAPGNPSTNPANWHNEPDPNDIWQARRTNNNGQFGPWVVQRIKGEKGSDGTSGSGFTVINLNPIQSIAVGSDHIASKSVSFDVPITVYSNTTQLVASASNAILSNNQFFIVTPASPLQGITVTKLDESTLRFTVAPNTVFDDESVTTLISVEVGASKAVMTTSFVITPIASAEDAYALSLVSSTGVVKYNGDGVLVTPSTVELTALMVNYSETVSWKLNGNDWGTGNSKTISDPNTLFPGGRTSANIRIETPNGLFDETTIVKVFDGQKGTNGSGFTVINSNPVQSVAVGSNNILDVQVSYDIQIKVFTNTTELSPSATEASLSDFQYFLTTPESPKPGITVTKPTSNTLRYTIAAGTSFTTDSVLSSINVKVGAAKAVMTTSFVITPVASAEDAYAINLVSSSNVVRYTALGNLVGPNEINLNANLSNYTDTVKWKLNGVDWGTGESKHITNPDSLFQQGATSALVRVYTESNGLFDETTIVKVFDGAKGSPGAAGSGFSVISSNPIQAIAIGSDRTLQGTKTYAVRLDTYSNTTKLSAANTNPVADNNTYFVVVPTGLPNGISVAKTAHDTLTFTVPDGTVFASDDAVVIPIKVLIGSDNVEMQNSFSIVPVVSSEDALGLSISASSTVVKSSYDGTISDNTPITLTAFQQNYSDEIAWETTPAVTLSGNGTTRTVLPSDLFPSGNARTSVKVRISAGTLFDELTIVRVYDGAPGPKGNDGIGIQGTKGPIPRLFEWVTGATYENGGEYIDYIYFRPKTPSEVSAEGWYTVKKPNPGVNHATANVGIPDTNYFFKEPFTNSATFGTVIAEQANIAGFIMRNQKFYSQATGTQTCSPTDIRGPYPNLFIDGFDGVIKFLERMVLDKNGITLKDDCGRERMAFKWGEDGSPILRFYNEDKTISWEAGKEGYVPKTVLVYPSTFEKFIATISPIPESADPVEYYQMNPAVFNDVLKYVVCKGCVDTYQTYNYDIMSMFRSVYATNNLVAGYKFLRSSSDPSETPSSLPYDKRIVITNGVYNSNPIANGWYITDIYPKYDIIYLQKVVDGYEVGDYVELKLQPNTFNYATGVDDCGTNGKPPCANHI